MAARILWFIKQLTPRTYWTTYGQVNTDDDGEHFVIWKMWLGRSYDVIDVPVAGPVAAAPNARAACYPLPKN